MPHKLLLAPRLGRVDVQGRVVVWLAQERLERYENGLDIHDRTPLIINLFYTYLFLGVRLDSDYFMKSDQIS